MRGEATRLSVDVRVDGDESTRPRLELAFDTNETVTAIMGPSGAGKTTLLLAVAGLVLPDTGSITIDGEPVFDHKRGLFVPPYRRKVGLLFQSLALFPHLAVWENVAYGLQNTRKKQRKDAAMTWLERARAAPLADRRPGTLSGGEAQRVALARALASEPRLLLLDEPFSALNHELRAELAEVLLELLAQTHTPALLVTHDPADARRMASRVLSLDAGRLVT